MPEGMKWARTFGLMVVVALHAVVLYALWSARVITPPAEMTKLFVSFVAPEPPPPEPRVEPPPKRVPPVRKKPEPEKPLPEKPVPETPPHTHVAANVPVVTPVDVVEPLPPPEPEPEPAPTPLPPAPVLPMGPVKLTAELAVSCPTRPAPVYPPLSRRLGETGRVVLRVELDESGRVSSARVLTSSGSRRLDEAALAAVGKWRCEPAQRDGQAVRAVATQAFNFTLEGR